MKALRGKPRSPGMSKAVTASVARDFCASTLLEHWQCREREGCACVCVCARVCVRVCVHVYVCTLKNEGRRRDRDKGR